MARAYTLTRIMPNGSDNVTQVFSTVDMTEEQFQALRAEGLAASRTLKAGNPGRRYVVYGPTDDALPFTADDRVWDSSTDL